MEYSSTKKIRLPGISTFIDDNSSSSLDDDDESSHEYREEVTPSRYYGYDGFQRFGAAVMTTDAAANTGGDSSAHHAANPSNSSSSGMDENTHHLNHNLKYRVISRSGGDNHHHRTPQKQPAPTSAKKQPPKSSTKSKTSRSRRSTSTTFSPTSSALNSVLHATAEAIVADSTSRRSMGERIVDRLDDFAEFVMGPTAVTVPRFQQKKEEEVGVKNEKVERKERERDLESCGLSAVEVVGECLYCL